MTITTGYRTPESPLRAHQQEYQDYLPLTLRLQGGLREDVDMLRAQEGWDVGLSKGVDDWVNDLGGIWRALRRHRYDPDKTLSALLATLTHRISLSLHRAPPTSNPYFDSALFHILPLPRYTTKIGQPVVVITLRDVRRDSDGGLGEMKEWTWWALEMVRRVLKGWWIDGDFEKSGVKGKGIRGGRGYGGEGCVLVVDAEGAGYRNLEVELLPTLLSVGHNHFPGVFDSVHVVNAGWTHRSMWTVVKRILPKSALEKVNFLDDQKALQEVFDLERLPKCYGGLDEWTSSPESNTILHYCSRSLPSASHLPIPSPGPILISGQSPDIPISSRTSSSSLADIFYTAENTPAQSQSSSRTVSRMTSRRGSLSGLAGTNALNDFRMTSLNLRRTRSGGQSETTPRTEDIGSKKRKPYSRRPSSINTDGMTPLQRIKSLSDFHLYLSPSRLANLDLLSDSSDSDSEGVTPDTEGIRPILSPNSPSGGKGRRESVLSSSPPANTGQTRRVLRPVIVDPEATITRAQSIADRRTRPPLRLYGVSSGGTGEEGESVRTYSDRLSLHHAHILKGYQKSPGPTDETEQKQEMGPNESNDIPQKIESVEDEPNLLDDQPIEINDQPPADNPTIPQTHIHRVSAYSRSLNPWFGYPALRLSPSTSQPTNPYSRNIIPLYPRNRKRDLIKTLLFLFMLRLQSIRDKTERWLGLHHLGAIPWNRRSEGWNVSHNPAEGLRMQEAELAKRGKKGGGMVKGGIWGGWKRKGEWVWMIICLVLFRGGWGRILGATVGLEGLREVLGLG